jgi:hypothetical protein
MTSASPLTYVTKASRWARDNDQVLPDHDAECSLAY